MMQRIHSVLQTPLSQPVSPASQAEQGSYFPQATRQNGFDNEQKKTAIVHTDADGLVPTSDKLLTFRSLTGIDTVPTLSTTGHSARAAPNIGIYPRVVEAERQAAQRYRLFHMASNFCLGAQIIVGAALTAIGAANGSRTAITAFGAMNTIMAAILTYMKASGLPEKLKVHENQWKEIREHIEQRERELCLANCHLDAAEEVAIVEEMYGRAKSELDPNNALSHGLQRANRDEAKSSVKTMVHRIAGKVVDATAEQKEPQARPKQDAESLQISKAEV